MPFDSKKPVHIPKNFINNRDQDIFGGSIEEDHSIEQYFWTSHVVRKIIDATQYQFTECCCFTTPSLAEAYHQKDIEQKLLDIDTRFSYLPRYERFDICVPHTPDGAGSFQILVIDPPFCGITTEQLFEATEKITNGDHTTKIIIAYLVRFEHALLKTFEPYGISETSTPLEYAGIKSNKWGNFALYSNVDLPGIKRIPGKYGYRGKNYNDLTYNKHHTIPR
jgi:hypothetical protein